MSNRKRDAKESSPGPEAKRPRLEGEGAAEAQEEPSNTASESGAPSTTNFTSLEVEMIEPADNAPVNLKPDIVKSVGNESFKENPYTFLSADDPILTSCMCVYYILKASKAPIQEPCVANVWTSDRISLRPTSLFEILKASQHGRSTLPMTWSRILFNTMTTPAFGSRLQAPKSCQNKRGARGLKRSSASWARVFLPSCHMSIPIPLLRGTWRL